MKSVQTFLFVSRHGIEYLNNKSEWKPIPDDGTPAECSDILTFKECELLKAQSEAQKHNGTVYAFHEFSEAGIQ